MTSLEKCDRLNGDDKWRPEECQYLSRSYMMGKREFDGKLNIQFLAGFLRLGRLMR